MNNSGKEILELVRLMAIDHNTVANAKYYYEGAGQNASLKEQTSRFIELLIRDGLAMGFEPGDDIGDIVWCLDDIAEHYHLLLSDSWFPEGGEITGWLKILGERWGRNGVRLLYIEDPKGKVFPVYAAAEDKVPAILDQAAKAGIAICGIEELEEEEEDDEAIDWSLG